MDKDYWVYTDKDNNIYTSPQQGRIFLMERKPNAARKYSAKINSDGVVQGYKKVRVVDV